MRRIDPPVRAVVRASAPAAARVLFGLCAIVACAQRAWPQTSLPLLYPSAITFDPQGNLYFAETTGHLVRKLTPSGILSTVAGIGTQGFAGDGGPATAASLDSPSGLALDAAGDVYIADTHNQRVRRIDAVTGAISTVAGTGVPGFAGDGGTATAARLDLPEALAVDAAGNLYIADLRNHRVRRVAAATGTITTVAGNGVEASAGDGGPATAASLDSPSGLALDAGGNLYIADTHNGRVRKVSAATGIISTVAGVSAAGAGLAGFSGDGGAATAATLALPRGLTIDDAGNLYIADSANHRIRRVASTGTITTVAGQGTEAFAGDGAPAVAASLDGPRSLAISPAGLLTLADTGNARVRQVDALPAPGPDIHTLAGIGAGVVSTGALTLTGPSAIAYGSGTVTATLGASSIASGNVTFLDTFGGTTATIGALPLVSDVAGLSTASLPAGQHSITATYAGDATHAAAQSTAFALTVTPLAIVATPNPASMLYGQSVPTLTGTLAGLLPQDAGKVTPVFTTTATPLAPVGSYPIAATLTGASAANYTVTTTPANLTIAQAPTVTTLLVSNSSPGVGVPVILTALASSATSGIPTGTLTLLDGTSQLAVQTVSPTGSASLTTSSLAAGSHSLSAAYAGDGNFLASTSAASSLTVASASDFTLTPTGSTSQSVPSGSPATYTFSVQTQGAALASAINLAVQGLPLGATASMNPAYLPPGGAVNSFTLTVQTPKVAHLSWPQGNEFLALLLFPLFGLARKKSRAVCGLALCLFAVGCGNRVNLATEKSSAISYTLTVTGSATSSSGGSLQHSTTVTLQVL